MLSSHNWLPLMEKNGSRESKWKKLRLCFGPNRYCVIESVFSRFALNFCGLSFT